MAYIISYFFVYVTLSWTENIQVKGCKDEFSSQGEPAYVPQTISSVTQFLKSKCSMLEISTVVLELDSFLENQAESSQVKSFSRTHAHVLLSKRDSIMRTIVFMLISNILFLLETIL